MYTVKAYNDENDKVGYKIHSMVGSNRINSGNIKKVLTGIDTFDFTIGLNNPGYQKLKPLKSLILVTNDKTSNVEFRGRVVSVDTSMSGTTFTQKVLCESDLAYLYDSTLEYEKVQNTSPKQFFEKLIKYHNDQVEPHKRFSVGKVTVTNSTDNVYRFIGYSDTYSTIKDKLLDRLGGYLVLNGNVINYLSTVGEQSESPIKLTKNMLSAANEINPDEIASRIIPVGADLDVKDDGTDNKDSAKPKLTIKSVNNGVKYLEDKNLVDNIGINQKIVEFNDVHDAKILKAKGQQALNEQSYFLSSWSVSALNLNLTNDQYEEFTIGNSYPIENEYLATKANVQLIEKDIDILEPQKSGLTLGDKQLKLSDYTANASKNQQLINKLQNDINDLNNQVPVNPNEDKPIGTIIDVSEWQNMINWKVLQDNELELAIIRVQDGSNYEDNNYSINIDGAISNDIKYGVYSVARFTSNSDAQNEAITFYNRTQSVVGTKRQPAFYMLDVNELAMSNISAGVKEWIKQMLALGVPKYKLVVRLSSNNYEQLNIDYSECSSLVLSDYDYEPAHKYDLWNDSANGIIAGINGEVSIYINPSKRFRTQYLGRKE